jgi:hypothetical protein
MEKLSDYVVRADGSVDRDATLVKFETELDNYIADFEDASAKIEAAVDTIFDTQKGAKLNVPFLVNGVLQALAVTPQNYTAMSEMVHDHITSNKGVLYHIAKGKGGGIQRLVDVVPEKK